MPSLLYNNLFSEDKRIDPVLLSQLVSKYSAENSLDTDFIHAIILAESSENPNAVSHAGAIGLMQLMPLTAKYLAEKMGENPPSRGDLVNPELNIRFGCYYLAMLKGQFGHKVEILLAAYNAGPTRVRRWLSANQDKDAVQVVLNCPIRETRMYIRKVLMFMDDRKEKEI